MSETFVGIVKCPQRLFPARGEVTITFGLVQRQLLERGKLVVAVYPDLRPVLILPTPSPTAPPPPPPPPAATPTRRP